jgi:hypothetical protein
MRKKLIPYVITGSLALAGCENENPRDKRLPEPRENQALILHPDYKNGFVSIGYTLLTDIDNKGGWDLAERVRCGFTTGDYSRKLFFKKGFGPAQSVDAQVEFVDPEFFDPFQ